MKVSAVTPKSTTRKETYGKEVTEMYLRRINRDKRDRENPRVRKAAIYLSEPAVNALEEPRSELSMDQQQAICRFAAKLLDAEVFGEFTDTADYLTLRPGLHQALELAQEQRLDYLIVSSLERLGGDIEDLFEVAWRLGHAGTVPMQTEVGREIP